MRLYMFLSYYFVFGVIYSSQATLQIRKQVMPKGMATLDMPEVPILNIYATKHKLIISPAPPLLSSYLVH